MHNSKARKRAPENANNPLLNPKRSKQQADKVQINRRAIIPTVTYSYLKSNHVQTPTSLLPDPTFEQQIDASMEPKVDSKKPVLSEIKKTNARWFEDKMMQTNPRNHDKPKISRNESFRNTSDESIIQTQILAETLVKKGRFSRYTVDFGSTQHKTKCWETDVANSFRIKVEESDECELEYGEIQVQKPNNSDCTFYVHKFIPKYEYKDFEGFRRAEKIVRKAVR